MEQQVDTTFDPFTGPVIARAVPSTPAQREIWAAALMGDDATLAYNEAVMLRLRGALDADALRAALTDLVQRHESLRATFSRDGLSMLIAEPSTPVITWYDRQGESPDAQSDALAELRTAVVTEPFDLELGPLVRFGVTALAPDDHAVLIVAHHIVCDGWSFGVIAQDLGRLYETRISARGALPEPDQFSEYAMSLSEPVSLETLSEDEDYWLRRFETIPEPCELPLDRPRPTHRSYPSEQANATFSPALTEAIRGLGKEAGSSVFVTLLGGFAALLARLSGQDDLVVGIASAGQPVASRPELVGHCVNTLPIRLHPSPELPFTEFLEATRGNTLDAFEHQGMGIGRLLERLAIRREPNRPPLVSVMFNLDRALSPSALAFGGLDVELETIPRRAENFELFINIVEANNGLSLECQYNTDLFDGATVRRWLASYEELLRSAAAAPRTPVAKLSICTDDDRAALARCNDSARAVPADATVHSLIAAQAARSADNVAVEQDGVTLTYRALDERSNQLARHLRNMGVTRASYVGICLGRTPDLLVALLGVLKAGACYVPLDPALPIERIAGMANDARLAAVVTDEVVRHDVDVPAPVVVSLDRDAHAIAACDSAPLAPDTRDARPSDPAYVIFTSGSTGKPKGVVLSHGGVVNLLLSVQETPGLRERDVVLAITTLGFDIAVSELLLPLTVGARIVLATRETASDGMLLRALIEQRGVTFIDATPATYRLLIAAGWTGGDTLRLICTGEAMPRELAATLVTRAAELWNGYGPTETTVWSTFHRVTAPVERVLIGRPVANTRIAILDANGEPTPVGVPGELFIGGAGVATGYLNRPDLTAERFTHDAREPGLRWYRTGDLVRLLPSGDLECLGRADDQVKIRGYRIEPGEIAALVSTWPGVRQAVVIAREDRADDVRLVGYVVADEGVEFGEAFRAHLKRTLPDYMLPTAMVRVESMPLTASGKIDKKALPAPDAAPVSVGYEYVAPRTETEQLLAGLWMQALGIGRVGIRDDFFALGGHSLLASQILSRLRRDHGIELTFRRIFEAPTIESLARLIDAARAEGTAQSATPTIVHRPGAESAPLSALQERLWMLYELDPTREPAHNHAASWTLAGPFDAAAMTTAFARLVERHPMLRTSFHVENGERRQRLHASIPFAYKTLDFSALDADAADAEIDAYFRAQQVTPFDFAVAPLFRAAIIKVAPEKHVLYTLQHGLVWDGWSFDVFLRDLSALYESEVTGRPANLPLLPVTYGDFAQWQRDWLDSPLAEAQQQWWDAQLGDIRDTLALPEDVARAKVQTFAGDHVSMSFAGDDLDVLHALARQYDGTLYMVMFAAYAVLLHLYTQQRDVQIATPMRARTQPELEDVLGPFVNTVVLRTAIEAGATFTDVLRQVRDNALDSFAHQELPFERLNVRLPMIRALFSMQDARERPRTMGPLAVSQRHVPAQFATNDLTMWMMQEPHRLLTVLNFSTETMHRSSALLFLTQFRALVAAIRQSPDARVDALQLLSREEVAAELALPIASAPAESALASIAHHAKAEPARVGVRHGSARMAYGDMWRRAGDAAKALVARGLSGETVAVDMAVGVERTVAMLAALRAGTRLLPVEADDAAGYKVVVVGKAGARLTVVRKSDDTRSTAVAALAELEAQGAALAGDAPVHAGSLALTWHDTDGKLVTETLPAARLDAQCAALRDTLALGTSSVVLNAVPSGTAAGVHALLATLAAGGTLVLTDDGVALDAEELGDEAARSGATVLVGTSDAWSATTRRAWNDHKLQSGLLVGEGLTEDALHVIAANTALHQAFGDASDAGLTALHAVSASRENWFVGQPIGATDVRVFDSHGEPRALGMSGVVHVARAGIDRAWRKTSRRARRASDGRVQLLASASEEVVIGGMRVDPNWIDAALRGVPGVDDAAIADVFDRSGAQRIVAYVVENGSTSVAQGSVRAALRDTLPAAWIPVRVMIVQRIPRTELGAVDRAALPSPFTEHLASETPANADELVIASVWKSLIGCEQVGRRDNFFQLGGTSLLCFRAIELIRVETSVRLSARTLLVGSLAEAAVELSQQRARLPK